MYRREILVVAIGYVPELSLLEERFTELW